LLKKTKQLKSKIVKNIFLNNLHLKVLNKYLILIIKQESKNSYVNIISMTGQVIYENHTGCLYKTSLRKTTYALGSLLNIVTNFLLKLNNNLKQLFIIIRGNYSKRGLKKKLFTCLKTRIYVNKIIFKPLIAHNGVRLKRKRRK
jgi:ribosomal protein S11